MLTPMTLRVSCACPCCGDEGTQIVSLLMSAPRSSLVSEEADPANLEDGCHEGHLNPCSACWQKHSAGLDMARTTLRERGELEQEPGRLTESWQGIPLRWDNPDAEEAGHALEDAVRAEMSILGLADLQRVGHVLVTIDRGTVTLSRVHAAEPKPALVL